MRRASALFHQLTIWGKETCGELSLGATVTSGGHGYRSVVHAHHSYVRYNAATVQSCVDRLGSFIPQDYLSQEIDGSSRPSLLERGPDCNASPPRPSATADSNLHLHRSAIAHLPSLRTSLSGAWSLVRPSLKFSGAALKQPLQRSGLCIQQSFPAWDQEGHRSWCSHDGRDYSSGPPDMPKRGVVVITVESTEHEKRCGMCFKMRPLREFQRQRSSPDGWHYWCRGCTAQVSRARRGLAPCDPDGQAHCVCCGETKDRALFGLEPRNRSGLQKFCRACVAEDYQTRPHVAGRSEKNWPAWAGAKRPVVMHLRREGGVWLPTEKVCLMCRELKDFSEYFSDASKNDGLRQYCKRCWVKKHSLHRTEKYASMFEEGKGPALPREPEALDEIRACFRWLVGDGEHPMLTAFMRGKKGGKSETPREA